MVETGISFVLKRTHIEVFKKFVKFIGPGIMVSVAYMDPGNYSTSVSGGAQFKYKLLFITFISNIFAIVLQCLCIKLGTVTGLDLAENCRRHFPKHWNYVLYAFAELAIIATDLAEVIGAAVALNILFHIPLVWGVLLTILDVLIILIFYKPDEHSMKKVRAFETFVGILVGATVICFAIELFKITVPSKLEVFKGFIPSPIIFKEQQAMYISLGILGATVMPHSLFLGSSVVKPRVHEYDLRKYGKIKEQPSIGAIEYTLQYSYAELIISLFFIATFVNASILIVAGATLYGQPDAEDADLLSIYELLSHYVSPAAGLVFALAMLFSGQSAGIICTMAGQIVSEGFLKWSLDPWLTRLVTRLIAIVPCFLVTIFLGEKGVSAILNLSQVVLSLILPIVSAPLIYFTMNPSIMTVTDVDATPNSAESSAESSEETHLLSSKKAESVNYTNSRTLTAVSFLIWITIGSLNCYLVFSYLAGADVHF